MQPTEFSVMGVRTGHMHHAVLKATKKQVREFIQERNHTAHYQGKTHTMYVRGKSAANIIEQLEKQYPEKNILVKVDTRPDLVMFTSHPM